MPLDCPRSIGTACTARSRLGLGVKERGANGLSGQGKAMTEGMRGQLREHRAAPRHEETGAQAFMLGFG